MKIAYVTIGIFLVGINVVTLWFLNRRADMIDDFNRASALLSDERKSAEEEYKSAMGLAMKAKGEGNYDLALTYAVNAIGHRGRGIDCFRMYFDLVVSASDQTPEWKLGHLDRIEKLIVGAIASVDVDDVEEMISLVGEVRKANDVVVAQTSESEIEAEPILKKEEIAHNKMTELVEHIAALKKKMEDDVVNRDLYAGMIRSDYQSIEVLYSALIEEDDEGMDKNIVDECGKLYQEAKQALVGFEQYLSKPYYDAICKEVEKIKEECRSVVINADADGRITKKLKEVNRRIADVRTKILKITDVTMAHEATRILSEDIGTSLDELSRKRMEAYQRYALLEIKAAAKCFDDKGTEFFNKDKDKQMREAWKHLQNVSPGLLVPEVSEFYSSVWNKLFDAYADGAKGPEDGMENDKKSKLHPPTRWKIQRAKERGKQLEDF